MKNDNAASASTVAGTGEFARKDQHVIAAVEIRGGVIHSVGFTTADGSIPSGSTELVRSLVGLTVKEALALDVNTMERHPSGICEVLFEAFYRAVETCLDPQ